MLRFTYQHTNKSSLNSENSSLSAKPASQWGAINPDGTFNLSEPDFIAGGHVIAALPVETIVSLVKALDEHGPESDRSNDNHLVQVIVAVLPAKDKILLYSSISGGTPLFYVIEPGRIRAAQSMATLKTLGVSIVANQSTAPEYLTYRTVAPKRTHAMVVERLLPGECAVYSLASGKLISRSTWMPSPTVNRRKTGDIVKNIGDILGRHITSVVAGEQNPGVLLSGGNDSSILALMTKRVRPDVATYTTSFAFADPDDMEISYARTVAESSQLRFQPVTPTSDEYLDGWVEAIATIGEPLDHLQTVLLHLLYKRAAREGTTMLVCGQMADALLGDSIMALIWKYRHAINFLSTTRLHRVAATLTRAINVRHPRIAFLLQEFGNDLAADDHLLWTLYRYGDPEIVRGICKCQVRDIFAGRRQLIADAHVKNLFDRMSVINYLGQAPGPLGQWANLASVQGIRFFYPFLVPEFVSYLYGLSWKEKFRLNRDEPKHALRALLREYGLREEYITRPKQSFGFKTEYWARPGALFQPVVDMASEVYGKETLRSLQQGPPAQAMVLWTALNYYLWNRLTVRGDSPDTITGEIRERRIARAGKS